MLASGLMTTIGTTHRVAVGRQNTRSPAWYCLPHIRCRRVKTSFCVTPLIGPSGHNQHPDRSGQGYTPFFQPLPRTMVTRTNDRMLSIKLDREGDDHIWII